MNKKLFQFHKIIPVCYIHQSIEWIAWLVTCHATCNLLAGVRMEGCSGVWQYWSKRTCPPIWSAKQKHWTTLQCEQKIVSDRQRLLCKASLRCHATSVVTEAYKLDHTWKEHGQFQKYFYWVALNWVSKVIRQLLSFWVWFWSNDSQLKTALKLPTRIIN